jgi:hypothetical protein
MRRARLYGLLIIVALAAASPHTRASSRELTRATSPLLQRFLDNPDPHPRSYRALRHLDAHNDHFDSTAWMDVWTEADQAGFRYEIAAEGGSAYIRDHVFRKTLETEQRLWASGAAEHGAFTPANYTFEERASDDDGLASLVVRPRRKDLLLVDGVIFVRPGDGELVRLEGSLSKTPSFWTRKVHITRWYERVAGIRMPQAIETVANVLIAGTSTFTMRYEYETMNGESVGVGHLRM